jgi:uncharacterized protein
VPEAGALAPRPLEAIAGFAAHLREHGYRVGVPEQQAMLRTALLLGVGEHDRVEAGWRSLVCGGPEQWRRFPELFRHYWFPDRRRGGVRVGGVARPRADLRQLVAELKSSAPAAGAGIPSVPGVSGQAASEESSDADHARGGASAADPLQRRDFRAWLPEDLDRLNRTVEAIARRLRARLTRRRRIDARGRTLDLRKTLRRSLRTGGVPFEPAWQERRRERPRLFILVDVSRSMELYARFFLQVARAFAQVLHARVFVFHTRLYELTPLLRRPSPRAQEKIDAFTAGFGGGTRIASCLGEFVRLHGRGALSRSARVVVMSDGFDSDEPGELARTLGAIRARGARIYWLHPSRRPPQSMALAACAGIVTAFAPVHNQESLSRLEVLID